MLDLAGGLAHLLGNITGPLKTLFDRNVSALEFIAPGKLPKPKHRGKKTIAVTASNSPFPFNLLPSQSRGTLRAVRTVLRAARFRIVKTIDIPNASRFTEVQE